MLGIKLEDSTASYDHTSKTFAGVRFVLLGFDPISDQKVRSRLVNGGGVDVGHYGPVCTHVIVHKLVYDDPICVAARMDGKVLVTGLWVDHSFDVGMLVDPASVMYRPLKGNDGIPGAKSLIVCLTGYQRQDRDDIMTMVGLMGANFSKPLVANKVTHLICYKFEGEKYELAKKIKRIKLVNHRWLEDCLKAWTILPETDYNKSGYELEMMEAEAKDSEEEEAALDAGTKQSEEMKIVTSPDNLMARARVSPQSKENLSKILPTLSVSKGLPHTSTRGNTLSASGEESLSAKMLNIQDSNKKGINVVGFLDPVGVTCDEPYCRTPTSTKEASNLVAHSDAAMLSSISYSRQAISRSTMPLSEGENKNNLVSCSRVDVDSINTNGSSEAYLSREEQHKVGNDTGLVRSPAKEESNSLSGKRKMDASSGNSKLPKTNPDSKASGSPLLSNVSKTSVTAVSVNASVDKNASPTSRYTSPVNKANAFPQSRYTSLDNMAKGNISGNEQMSSSKCISKLEEPRNSSIESENMGLPIDHGIDDIETKTEFASIESMELQRKQEDAQAPSPNAKSLGIENLSGPKSQILKASDCDLLEKPVRKKAIAKRTWNSGSKRKVGLGKSKNQKGSIYLHDGVPASIVENNDCVNPKKSPPNVDFGKAIAIEVNDVENPENEHMDKMGSVNDETEAPEDKEAGFFHDVSVEKAEEANEVNMAMKDKSECTISSTTNADDKAEGTSSADVGGAKFEKKDDGGENEADEPTTSKGRELEKSTKSSLGKTKLVQLVSGKRKSMVGVSTEEYENKAKKQKMGLSKGKSNLSLTAKAERKVPLDKADISNEVEKENRTIGNKKSVPSVSGKRKSKEGISGDETENKMNNQKIGLIKENSSPATTAKTKRKPPFKKAESPIEVEKENRPVDIHDPNVGQQIAKAASNIKKMPAKIRSKDGVTDQGSVLGALNKQTEPTWFILTGHKLQRKELQLVIKRLRGRVCRDSHQWSYQATHLIFPDPLRRTEKFFAAAASGRWILKTDYLATCNQEGKFLAEEPYEWYKKGLSEDGAINLEAPRKWRLLRERTGHGALYGMRVIIYGECIAPPLDTLKRVVKAGDGTILATSPPYSRFLNSGVDYAIVSPGMPRVDMWIQEFLRHEIPCVVADYLVEYVCKPGYPLEKHVQYSTQAWAERSFTNLQNRSEEIVLDKEVPEEDTEDVPCQVCGSTDRGEVMLICGDESGSLGCGVGTHIDCCSPPLESVPEEDWFCPKCSESKKSKGRSKSTK